MRWPWTKKTSVERDREQARRDTASLGNLLLRLGMVTAQDLHDALEYQDDNPDRMLGEALVHRGVVEKEIVEAVLAIQQLQRKPGRRHLAQVVEIAKNRKKPLQDAHDRVVAAAMSLTTVK